MKYASLSLGDWVEVIQNPQDFSHVIKQFEGRIGSIVDKWSSATEYRVRIHFGDDNDLWLVSTSGDFQYIKGISGNVRWEHGR